MKNSKQCMMKFMHSFSEWSKAFNDYSDSENLVSESNYSQGLEKLKSYLESKKS